MKEKTTRKNIRLKDFDYSQPRYYHVTICAATKEHIFGEITKNVGVAALCDPQIKLSNYGTIVLNIITTMDKINNCSIDCFCIMPNHIHFIVNIEDENKIGSQRAATPTNPTKLPQIVKALKVLTNKMAGFNLWQRNYHEHIIRNEKSLNGIRKYIEENPAKWADDPYNLK